MYAGDSYRLAVSQRDRLRASWRVECVGSAARTYQEYRAEDRDDDVPDRWRVRAVASMVDRDWSVAWPSMGPREVFVYFRDIEALRIKPKRRHSSPVGPTMGPANDRGRKPLTCMNTFRGVTSPQRSDQHKRRIEPLR